MLDFFPKTKKKCRAPNFFEQLLTYNRSLSYQKLRQKNLILSVLKLDGSSFSFHVARNATVAMLKLAIQEEFSLFPKDDRDELWSLVWSNFCLCYEGQKLIQDTVSIQKYGIKDGDQLHFIQHLNIDLAPTQKQSKNVDIKSRQCPFKSDKHCDDQHAKLTPRRSGSARSLMGLLPWLKFKNKQVRFYDGF